MECLYFLGSLKPGTFLMFRRAFVGFLGDLKPRTFPAVDKLSVALGFLLLRTVLEDVWPVNMARSKRSMFLSRRVGRMTFDAVCPVCDGCSAVSVVSSG